MVIMRGDACNVPFDLKDNGQLLTADKVSEIEVHIGNDIRKLYSAGEVWFDKDELRWYFRLSQEETFSLNAAKYAVIVRVKFAGNAESDVGGFYMDSIILTETFSKNVL